MAKLDPKTDSVLQAMSDKLASAKTIRVKATRETSSGFYAGAPVAERATGSVVVRRPGQLLANAKTSLGARTIGFDNGTLTLIDHTSDTHSIVKASADLDGAVRQIQHTYGFIPPVAELLVNDPHTFLLEGVTSVKYIGLDKVGGVECDHMAFEQEGFAWELWVAKADSLPRQISVTHPNGEGGAPLKMSATMTQWELDASVTDSDLTAKIPSGSRAIEMIPLAD
nr:DUF2092 domain-containing protein [Phragmitibacter flavus]